MTNAFLDSRRYGRFNPLFTIACDVRLRVILFRCSAPSGRSPKIRGNKKKYTLWAHIENRRRQTRVLFFLQKLNLYSIRENGGERESEYELKFLHPSYSNNIIYVVIIIIIITFYRETA